MSTEIDQAEASLAEPDFPSDDIQVRRAPGPEASIVAAAKAWARALEAKRRQETAGGETAELALYDAVSDAHALRSAELALYQVILASGLK